MILNLRKEEELLLCCSNAKIKPDIDDKITSLLSEDLDWKYLIKMASYHRFKPILYWHINRTRSQNVPEDIRIALKDYYEYNLQKNLLMWGELLNISKKCDENGLKIIPYKGSILALMAYDNLSLREFDDIDLYVSYEDIPKVKKILISSGYELSTQLTNSQEKVYNKFQRELTLINKFNNILVELKWKFPVPSFSFQEDPNIILSSGSQKIELNHAKIETLTPEYLLILLSLHNAGHYWPYLSWICDISELLKSQKFFDWPLALDTASRIGACRILNINLLLSYDLFETKIPVNVLSQLKQDDVAKVVSEKIKNNLFSNKGQLNLNEKIILRLKIRENKINKTKDFFKLIFNPTTEVITSTQLHYYLYPAYFFLRLIQIIKNIFKEHLLSKSNFINNKEH